MAIHGIAFWKSKSWKVQFLAFSDGTIPGTSVAFSDDAIAETTVAFSDDTIPETTATSSDDSFLETTATRVVANPAEMYNVYRTARHVFLIRLAV
jgi:hypothetical protein